MRNYQKRLVNACHDLGLEIHIDAKIKFPSGQTFMAPVHIPQLGGQNGIIVTSCYEEILELEKQLGQSLPQVGYGYSVLSDLSDNDNYDREVMIEMFSDWGWGGSEETKPKWMKPQIDDEEGLDS